MTADPILFERRDAVARITLNRPDVLNSFNTPMFQQLIGVIGEIASDASVRAVYLTGAGRGFCAGQDISGGDASGSYGDHLRNTWNHLARAIHTLDRPIVCAVNGVAAGAGANIALACDFVVAAEEASFIQAFINIGLIPDCGGTHILPRLAGRARANAMAMLGEKVPAKQAAEWGMIYRAVPLAALEQEAWSLALRLAAMPTLALGHIKKLLNASGSHTLPEQLELEADAQEAAGFSQDHKEGVAAFREKRKPDFCGH